MGRRDGHGHSYYARTHGCNCEECEDALERRRMTVQFLPAAVLRDVIPKSDLRGGGDHWSGMGGAKSVLSPSMQRILYRALEAGFISYVQADTLATALGHHPSDIWGRAWEDPAYYADQLELNSPEFRSLETA